MRIGRTVFIPAILALGVAGTSLAASAVPVAAAQSHAVHAHVLAGSVGRTYYHC